MRYVRQVADERDDVVATERTSIRQPFGAAQVFNLVMGILFLVVGVIALARTGLHSLTGTTTTVGPLRMTPLYALVHVAIGLIALLSAASRTSARSMAMVLGALLIAVGIITLVQPVRAMGWVKANGVLDLILGGVALATALMTPLASYGERRVRTRAHERIV